MLLSTGRTSLSNSPSSVHGFMIIMAPVVCFEGATPDLHQFYKIE